MKLNFKPTNAHLEIEANNVERFAKDALTSWVLLGQTERYVEEMRKVYALRRAMTIKGVRARREYLEAV